MQSIAKTITNFFDIYPVLFVILGFVFAIVLNICRSRWQIFYGIIEIITGIGLLFLSIQVTGGDFSNGFSNDFEVVSSTVTLTTYLGAVFVIARGLDNVRQSYFTTKVAKV